MTLRHVTLTTGHTRQSPRSEVGADVLVMLRGWLRDALGGAVVVLQTPSPARYTLTASAGADALDGWARHIEECRRIELSNGLPRCLF